VNIDANRVSIADPDLRAELDDVTAVIEGDLGRADAIVRTVREQMAG
jgi:hypothetical protein